MKTVLSFILAVNILLTLADYSALSQSTDSRPGKDTLNQVYVTDTFLVSGRILVARDGTGLIPFRNITSEQLNYIFELLAYFEQGNKLKKWLKDK